MNTTLLDKLAQHWKNNPHQRLCQLIVNLTKNDPFYVRDEELEEKLDKALNVNKTNGN